MWLEDDREDPRGHVVVVHGELVGRSADALFTAVDDVLQGGAPGVIVDLSDSAFMDSTGIAALIACWRVATSSRSGRSSANGTRARQLGLVLPAEAHMRRVLQMRGIDHLFAVAPSRDQTFSRLGVAS